MWELDNTFILVLPTLNLPQMQGVAVPYCDEVQHLIQQQVICQADLPNPINGLNIQIHSAHRKATSRAMPCVEVLCQIMSSPCCMLPSHGGHVQHHSWAVAYVIAQPVDSTSQHVCPCYLTPAEAIQKQAAQRATSSSDRTSLCSLRLAVHSCIGKHAVLQVQQGTICSACDQPLRVPTAAQKSCVCRAEQSSLPWLGSCCYWMLSACQHAQQHCLCPRPAAGKLCT